jgi:hypothetical protein
VRKYEFTIWSFSHEKENEKQIRGGREGSRKKKEKIEMRNKVKGRRGRG